MKLVVAVVLGTVMWLGGLSPARAQLDCDANANAVQDAINAAFGAGQNFTFIQFTGTCNSIEVFGMEVYIQGSGDASIAEFVNIFSAGAYLEDFTVQGDGIFVSDGAFIHDLNRVVMENGELFVLQNSGVRVRNSDLTGRGDTRPVTIIRNSFVRSSGGNVFRNPCDGLPAEACEPTVSIGDSSAWLSDGGRPDRYEGNIGIPSFRVIGSSHASLRQGHLDDVAVDFHSTLALSEGGRGNPEDIVIDGNVAISRDSAVSFGSDLNTLNGRATCEDNESSLAGRPQGKNVINCTPF